VKRSKQAPSTEPFNNPFTGLGSLKSNLPIASAPAAEKTIALSVKVRRISSRGEPSAMTLPWSTTATRSQSRSASSM